MAALQGVPSYQSGDQIHVLQSLPYTLNNWAIETTPKQLTSPQPRELDKWDNRLPPKVHSPVLRVKTLST